MGKEPDPHAYHPNSMDLNDAADMRDEAEQAFNDARKTRGKRDLLYVAVMACVIVMLTGAVCGRKDIIIASAVIALDKYFAFDRNVLMRRKPGMLPHEKITPHLPREQCRPRKRTRRRRLPEHHGMPSPLENILTTIFTPDIVSGTRGNNEGNRRGKH